MIVGEADHQTRPLVVDPVDTRQRGQHLARRVELVDLEVHGVGRADKIGDGTRGDQVATIHHDGVRADLLHLGEDVTREHHGGAGVGEAMHQEPHLTHLARVETVGRLVEHQHLGTAQQHAGEAEPLLHPLRVRLDASLDRVAEIGDRQRVLEVGISETATSRTPPQLEVLHARQVWHERRGLDERSDPCELGRAGTNAGTEQERLPRRRLDQSEEHSQRSGLPRAVRAEQATHLAGIDREAEVVDGEHAGAESFGEPDQLDDRVTHECGGSAGDISHGESIPSERSVDTHMPFFARTTAPSPTIIPLTVPADTTQPNPGGPRMPRDAQRRRVYLAETPLPSSPLPGLDACAGFVDRVVGTLWWNMRFPEHHLGAVPRLRPGNGARQAFFRDEPTGPTITLPRRYRTKGVVLHELVHWALGLDSGLPAHGRTFARVLLDVTAEFSGAERAGELTASYKEQRVHVGKPARMGPDGRFYYGWDERLRLGRGRDFVVRCASSDDEPFAISGRFEGFERSGSIIPLHAADGSVTRVRAALVYDAVTAREEHRDA